MKILHLNVTKKWFDMILSGEKKEEYRGIKPYWSNRFFHDGYLFLKYSVIEFRNGYSSTAPHFQIELLRIDTGIGRVEWGAPKNKSVYILKLGEILK